MAEERRVWCDGGLLSWDGRVLEYFPTKGRGDVWRVHAATVIGWELQQRRGVSLLVVSTDERWHRSVLVRDADGPMVRHIMDEVDEVT